MITSPVSGWMVAVRKPVRANCAFLWNAPCPWRKVRSIDSPSDSMMIGVCPTGNLLQFLTCAEKTLSQVAVAPSIEVPEVQDRVILVRNIGSPFKEKLKNYACRKRD